MAPTGCSDRPLPTPLAPTGAPSSLTLAPALRTAPTASSSGPFCPYPEWQGGPFGSLARALAPSWAYSMAWCGLVVVTGYAPAPRTGAPPHYAGPKPDNLIAPSVSCPAGLAGYAPTTHVVDDGPVFVACWLDTFQTSRSENSRQTGPKHLDTHSPGVQSYLLTL